MARKFIDGTESGIICPYCSPIVKLVVRTNKKNGSQFLACPNYPDCDYTEHIPESWKMKMAGQKELL